MEYTLLDFLKLVGSLGVFLFGMKLMSEALQAVAGDKMRNILAAMTSKRILGVLTGFLITAVIQSSSATTVMLVSFVNAGLINLVQSVGVVMGANIGTTITAWLISILGFKINISAFSLPLIGLGFPLMFSKKSRNQSWGNVVIGFALIFMGLEFLKESVPNIKDNPHLLEFLSEYANAGFWSVLLFLGIGTLLTVIIQSSSATMALTLVMCNNGWISFDLAAAMVLGENIGTTVTANIAAVVANKTAKQTARVHFMFNVFGVIWILALFRPFLGWINSFMVFVGGGSPFQSPESIPISLSIFHSSFNILNVMILFGFAPLLARISRYLVRDQEEEEEFHLRYITIGTLSTAELSLLQAKKEIELYGQRVYKMFGRIREMYVEKKEHKFEKHFRKIEKYENAHDLMEMEIAKYLAAIGGGELSSLSSNRLQGMFKTISEIESISDSNYNLAKTLMRKWKKKTELTPEMDEKLQQMFILLDDAFRIMNQNLEKGYREATLDEALAKEEEINRYRDQLRQEHLKNVEKKKYSYMQGIIYNDLFAECEKLGDFIINVTEAITQVKSKTLSAVPD